MPQKAMFACCRCEFIGWNNTLSLLVNVWGLGASSAVQLCGSQSKLYDTRKAFGVGLEEEQWCGETLEEWFRKRDPLG